MDVVKLFEILGLEDFRKKHPFIFRSIVSIFIILALVLIFLEPIIKLYSTFTYFDVTIKFQTLDRKPANSFENSQLSIWVDSESKTWPAIISSSGYAQIRNEIPTGFRNKQMSIEIESDQYLLVNATKLYGLDDTIYVKVKPVPDNYHVIIKDSIPIVQKIVSCPKVNQDGISLSTPNHDKPGEKPGYKWVSGYYTKINNVCSWKNGVWVKLTINDCPKNPPNGYKVEKVGTARKGYFWQPGKWVLQDNECTWRSGSWQKSQGPILPDRTQRPAPTYVPPPKPPTYSNPHF